MSTSASAWTVETWIAVLTFCAAVVGGIVTAGVWATKLILKLAGAIRTIDNAAKLVTDVAFIKDALEREGQWRAEMNEKFERHIKSDHRELRGELRDTRDIAIRAATLSSHDLEDE